MENDQDYDQDDDDLMIFKQEDRLQAMQQHGILFEDVENIQKQKFNNFLKQDASEFQTKKQAKQNKSAEINQQELSAKRLRAYDATKYFEKIKLAYLAQIHSSIDIQEINNKQTKFYMLLSKIKLENINIIQKLRSKHPTNIKTEQILNLFQKIFQKLDAQTLQNFEISKKQAMFWFAQYCHAKIRKIEFFDLHNYVDQNFYNLNFQKYAKKGKKKPKGLKSVQEIKNKIQRQIFQESIDENIQYLDLNSFTYQKHLQNKDKTQQQIDASMKISKKKGKKIAQIKKNFKNQTYQIFCFVQNKWILFESITNHFEETEIDWFKDNVLNGLPIVGFYSVQRLNAKKEYRQIFKLRKTDNLIVKDMTMWFSDCNKDVISRRKRVGIRPIMGKIFRFFNYRKPYGILEDYEAHQFAMSRQLDREQLIAQVPKTQLEMNLNDYFTTPSRVSKYLILDPQANPISDIEFNEQKMYWKDDLVPIGSRMGWIDFNRMVIQGEQPLKKTQNKNKKAIQLFRYQQTKPYKLQIDQQGNFILDPQHNSVYVSPKLQLPEGTCIVKEHITFICNKHKFKFAKLVQGFVHSGMRVLPNQIGSIVYEKDRQQILRLHQERQIILNKNRQGRKDEKVQKMWRQLLKYIKLVERITL